MNTAFFPDDRAFTDHGSRADFGSTADLRSRLHNGVRPNADVLTQYRRLMNKCGGMDSAGKLGARWREFFHYSIECHPWLSHLNQCRVSHQFFTESFTHQDRGCPRIPEIFPQFAPLKKSQFTRACIGQRSETR